MAIGSNRLKLGALSLPLDLGLLNTGLKGCMWHSSMDLALVPGALNGVGKATVALPIPNDPKFVGLVLYSQALLFNPLIPTPMMTNGFATAIGH